MGKNNMLDKHEEIMDIQRNNLFNKDINFPMPKTTKIIESPKTDVRVLLKIHKALRERKWGATDLARRLGFSPQYGGYLMRGARKISIDLLLEIADKLDVEPSSLLPGKTNPSSKPTLEEYFRTIIREELDTYLKDKK